MKRKESVAAAAHSYTVLLQPEPEGGYTMTRPTLPGLVTDGATLEEARAMAADAIRATSSASKRTASRSRKAIPSRCPWLTV